MATAEKTYKASVSLRERNWKVLADAKNKSKIINQALDWYFDFEQKRQEKYEEWYANFIAETLEALEEGENGGGTPVPMKDGKIDRKAFMKEIWS